MLPTLLVWRAQLQAVHALEQQQRERSRRTGQAGAAAPILQGSQYARLCLPVLQAAEVFGSWLVPLAGAALAGFVAALLVQSQAARSGGL
jgi:hypothetical protein